ncbi:MAG: RagB/SusD family nutrient uptake outer membrane protein, partial [Dysgonamonadaceae bacterium]|nr:RagB/SusD family nutrient uptake outer membrane protein [Dysgonamonadaceae bacterium]
MNYLKYIKHYAGLATIVWMATGFFSCSSDFLEEKYIRGGLTTDYTTTAGLDELSIGMYQNLEFHFWNEWSYTMYNYGTDEMAVGNDGSREQYNSYTSALNPDSGDGVSNLWESMYSGISAANTMIANVPQYYDKSNALNYNTRLGEGYFMRGFNYLRLVAQYGGVPLVKENIPTTDFERSEPKDVYELIIADLKEAYKLLPPQPAQPGRITKWAAAHYIAKACLFRASEQNDAWNSSYKTQDLEDVIKYGDEVIAAHPLCV